MAATYQVRLYTTLAAFRAKSPSVILPAGSAEKAARRAAYALLEVSRGPTPGQKWMVAECRSNNGSWKGVLLNGN